MVDERVSRRTEAGRRLTDWAESDSRPIDEFGFDLVQDAIVAIEAEAIALRDAELAAAVEGLPGFLDGTPIALPHLVHRAAVLRLLRDA